MSRTFTNAAPVDALAVTATPASGFPLTMACWAKSDSDTARQVAMCITDISSAVHYFSLEMDGAQGGDPVRFGATAGAASSFSDSATGFSTGTWHHICGVEVNATSRFVYLDGVAGTEDTTSRTPAGLDTTITGALGITGPTYTAGMTGAVWGAAIWNRALSAAEVLGLSNGVHPRSVEGCVWDNRMDGDEDFDRVGKTALTAIQSPGTEANPPGINFHGLRYHHKLRRDARGLAAV